MVKERLGNIISFQRGYDLTHSQMRGGDVPVIGSNEIIGWHNLSKSKAPTLLIGRSGTVGRPQYYDSDAWPHNTTLFVTDYHGNNPKYCYYLLQSMNLEDYANSSGVPTLNRNFIEPLIVEYHKKEEQDKIADILGGIDNKILTNKKIVKISEKLMHEIYDYWFVQFDFPNENGCPYKSSGGEMVYNETLKREIPKGWEVIPLSSIASIKSGFPFSSDDYATDGRHKVITIKNVQDGFIDYTTDNSIDAIPDKMPDYCRLSSGEILMSLTGNTGRVGLTYGEDALLNQRVAKIEPNQYDAFVYILLRSEAFQSKIQRLSNGSSQKNLSPIGLSKIPIIYNQKYVQEVSEHIHKLYQNIIVRYAENMKLASLRDWLLPMLMNGQVKATE